MNPSSAGEPFVSDVVITDADAEAPSTLSVSFALDDLDVTTNTRCRTSCGCLDIDRRTAEVGWAMAGPSRLNAMLLMLVLT